MEARTVDGAPLVRQAEVGGAERERRGARFPAGAAIEFADLEQHSRAPALDRLREREPVSWVSALGGWLVTSHALAREMLSPRTPFTVLAEENLVRASLGLMMLTSDGEGHDRRRAPFDEPFRMRSVQARFAAPVEARVEALLAKLEPKGEAELAGELASPFAIGVAGDILGLSLDDVPRIRRFYDAFAGAMTYDGDPEPKRRADEARAELDAILLAELARVRAAPDGSITSAVSGGGGLSDAEIASELRVILFGAIETVESMLLNSVLLLLRHPDQLDELRADPSLLPNAVEEALRCIPPVAFIERWSAEPLVLGGVELGRGEFVGVSTVAANRDPGVFRDPLRFDVRRANARHHLAFSHGSHHCLGFTMARLQGATALGMLLERLRGLELVDAPEPAGFAFRRPAELRVRWDRRS